MEALLLDSLEGKLTKVAEEFGTNPALTIKNINEKLTRFTPYFNDRFDAFDFFKDYTNLPFGVFSNFSFEDICKLRFSSTTMLDSTVENLFENEPNFEVIRKIKSSWWRWGVGKGDWNELVDVYNGICSFSLPLPSEFAVRLDYTTGYNPHSYSQFTRTYIDGVFAFLVYYRGTHVMTIGFSVMENYRLLIQQVQLKNVKGNRFLYRLPKQYVEFVIDQFLRAFPSFTLYMVDGKSLAEKILADYESSMTSVKERLDRDYRQPLDTFALQTQRSMIAHIESMAVKIQHLQAETPRLQELYTNCGQYKLAEKLTVNKIVYRRLRLQLCNTNVTSLG